VVGKPHAVMRQAREKGILECADERHQASENWNCTGGDVGDDHGASRAAEPRHPVCNLLRAVENTD
jgi:hypothetical protein